MPDEKVLLFRLVRLFPTMLGVWSIRLYDIENSRKMFLITGMAAGFSGLFCTRLLQSFCTGGIGCRKAGISCLIPATVASISAAFTSRALGLRKFHINILETLNYHPSTYNAVFL
ncbi:MAG: hypothetical protein ACLU92_11210 [Coprococcus comes]